MINDFSLAFSLSSRSTMTVFTSVSSYRCAFPPIRLVFPLVTHGMTDPRSLRQTYLTVQCILFGISSSSTVQLSSYVPNTMYVARHVVNPSSKHSLSSLCNAFSGYASESGSKSSRSLAKITISGLQGISSSRASGIELISVDKSPANGIRIWPIKKFLRSTSIQEKNE
jgi:hypothetical protein